jgi:RimJ/RimL family protein N-acetyltransferase
MNEESMSFYAGPKYLLDEVSIGPADLDALRQEPVREPDLWYLAEAPNRDDVCYFSIYRSSELVGAIFLHDIDLAAGETLIGYQLFDPARRGQGIGTKALTLLKRYVWEQTTLRRVLVITSRENAASQRIALKSGFIPIGSPREDPENGVILEWRVQRRQTERQRLDRSVIA